MRFSNRIMAMQSSPIRRLIPYADEAKAKGKKVYHLNIGQPDIKTPPSFLQAIKDFAQEVIAYSTSQGSNELRDAMRRYYEGYDIHFEREHILVTNGGSEAIMFAVMATCDPGEEILIPEPFYANYNAFSKCVNVNIVPITTKAEEGFHLPPKEKIEAVITPKTRCILISNPGNPTGTIYTADEMRMLADLAKKHDLYIIADEVYREFVYDGLKYTSFGNLSDVEDRVIIIDSVSKRYSACGARIGCVASKNEELMKQILKLCQGRLCVPTLEQVGATALYNTPVSYLEEVNKEYQSRRDTLYKALQSMPGVVCEQPKGAFYVVVKMPVDDAEKFVIWMLQNFDINGETMMAAPAEGFYATPGLGKNEARLAYVLKNEDLVKAMDILKAALEAYPGRVEPVSAQ
ncbi:MAG: pyridoxal phosphate-dependent aminotransferase [Aminobacterium colombiense]|jgi:aspartate aminotransferase|uniref:pyridoxal phosphate-dependent aminotransferase n=1 Tax=Aminobacterium TaxID=81466 RepID=UPI000B2200BE|nr:MULTISPECIES: pyridoxal phosphate-dependent aminotransferase [unclassified Aminobacterium]MDD2378750.1 pyridoxal phosphate-dependent aminotransferase [Aminobacterium colombiense]MDD4265181.1 pyridoxal phosphate-dependent aminotransferase [Aminobacterium colombiense]MDD4585387.1 pyridoxal phosphate-dependent aminotransferase [Aminobacterium colombiense]NLK29743.1 pyridoxal phosphate-dependent aminotransferase [Aminobacterium colombiense]